MMAPYTRDTPLEYQGAVRRVGIALITVITACHTWNVQPGTSVSAVQSAIADSTQTIRLTLMSGAIAEIARPNIVGDSVIGVSVPSRQHVAFAMADVRSVARHEISDGRTVLVILGVPVGIALVIYSAAFIGFASHRRN